MATNVDVGLLAQRVAEEHLDHLFEAQEREEEGEENVEWPASAGPFCGCPTCVVREVLWAAWPIFEEHA